MSHFMIKWSFWAISHAFLKGFSARWVLHSYRAQWSCLDIVMKGTTREGRQRSGIFILNIFAFELKPDYGP